MSRPLRLALFCVLLVGCGQTPAAEPPVPTLGGESPDPPIVESCEPPSPESPSGPHLFVYFSCTADGGEMGNRVHALARGIDPSETPLSAAFERLLEGPTPAESERGYVSAFSAASSGLLQRAEIQGGQATIDFADLREALPLVGATTSTAMFLSALYSTAFQFDGIEQLRFTMQGACETFWVEWLEAGACQDIPRSFWEENTTTV